jgi:hypothetical protein
VVFDLMDEYGQRAGQPKAQARIRQWVAMFGPEPGMRKEMPGRLDVNEFHATGHGVGLSASDITSILSEALNTAADGAVVQRHPDVHFIPFPTPKDARLYIHRPDGASPDPMGRKAVKLKVTNERDIAKIVTFDLQTTHVLQAMRKLPTSVTLATYQQSLKFGASS